MKSSNREELDPPVTAPEKTLSTYDDLGRRISNQDLPPPDGRLPAIHDRLAGIAIERPGDHEASGRNGHTSNAHPDLGC
jgi:hypothetical protein